MRRFILVAASAAFSVCAIAVPSEARTRVATAAPVAPAAVPEFDDSGRWPGQYAPMPANRATAPVAAERGIDQYLRDLVSAAAAAAGVPVNLAHAVVRMESNYRPHVVSRARALGIAQIKCQTARSVGFSGPCSGLFNPESNLRFAMKYLRQALDRGGEGCSGLALYERGIAARPVCTAYGRKAVAFASHAS